MHKKTRKGKIMPKACKKLLTRGQKKTFWWGREKVRQPGIYRACGIDAVWMCATLEISRQVVHVRTSNLTVRSLVPHTSGREQNCLPDWATPVQTPGETVQTLNTEKQKTEEKIAEFNFSQVSFWTRMYNPLIPQSRSITKLSKDIKESWVFNQHKYFLGHRKFK
jgi:hypothetical protein